MLKLPATGTWNGFLGHLNIIECYNLSGSSFSGTLQVKNQQGVVLTTIPLFINTNASLHIPLNPSLINNTYGTFMINHLASDDLEPQISCSTMIYRFSATGALEYAFALPLESAVFGERAGVFNSINPEGELKPVFNWLSVFNLGDTNFSGKIQVYDHNGRPDALRSISLANLSPGRRVDFPLGHDQGQVTGLYRIVPDSDESPYGAFLTRYSERDSHSFNFAFPLFSQSGSCDLEPIYLSTMDPATNWLEIANPSATPIKALIKLSDQVGSTQSLSRIIPAFSQTHIYVNEFLGERNLGSAVVNCLEFQPGAKLIVQSLYYGRSSVPGEVSLGSPVKWAYASQAEASSPEVITAYFAGINTNLGAPNWVAFLNGSENTRHLTHVYHDVDGNRLGSKNETVLRMSTLTHEISSLVGHSFIGRFLSFSFDNSSQTSAEVLRVFSDKIGNIGYVMNVPKTALTLSIVPDTAYFLVSVIDQNFVIALNDQALIAHARALLHDSSISANRVSGRIVKSRAAYNPEWNFHLAPDSIRFFGISAEVCDALPSFVEDGTHTFESFCPWQSKVIAEVRF